jgi:hypothetical protein
MLVAFGVTDITVFIPTLLFFFVCYKVIARREWLNYLKEKQEKELLALQKMEQRSRNKALRSKAPQQTEIQLPVGPVVIDDDEIKWDDFLPG